MIFDNVFFVISLHFPICLIREHCGVVARALDFRRSGVRIPFGV